VKIADEADVMAYAAEFEEPEMVRTVQVLDKPTVRAFAQAMLDDNGELMPGMAVVPESVSVSYKLEAHDDDR
jgi:hypothetical protein